MAYKDEIPFRDQFINTAGDTVVIHYKPPADGSKPNGLAFMEHGLFSGSETTHNAAFAVLFRNHGFATIQVDATNSNNNASGGDVSRFTIERHTLDLQETIDHVTEHYRPFLPQKFALVGHSMGGISVIENAAHPQIRDHVDFVVALAPVISGKHLEAGWQQDEPEQYAAWRETGIYPVGAESPYNQSGILPFSAWHEWNMHNAYEHGQRIKSPVLFVAGGGDLLTPAEDAEVFAASLPADLGIQSVTIPKATHRLKNVYGAVEKDRLSDILHSFLLEQ